MRKYFTAALVADALSLGPHWIYDQEKLERMYPAGVRSFTDPVSNYHTNRVAGEQTHFGDQMILLKGSLKKRGGFDETGWQEEWIEGMTGYDGYMDGATKETLAAGGVSPSGSNDLSGASRLAPILDLDLPVEDAVAAARAQTGFTHGDIGVSDAAEFFVRSTYALREGETMYKAFLYAAEEGSYEELDVAGHLKKVRGVLGEDFRKVGTDLGLTCHLPEAFPLALFFALRDGADFESAVSDNGLCGGDSAARAMLFAVLFEARDGDVAEKWVPELKYDGKQRPTVKSGANPVEIPGIQGKLSGILEMPEGEVRGFALFAHCFTCGKDFQAGARVSRGLAKRGIATLRIDFAGIGASEGAFSDSSFLTNVADLMTAAEWLKEQHSAPVLLVGHSLGGAAVLSASLKIPSVRAVATIGAPADPSHVTHLLGDALETLKSAGAAAVTLAGRSFDIGARFFDDLDGHDHQADLAQLRDVDVLIMHAPEDATVGIENAGQIFSALMHPKSFVSLAGADHLLTDAKDAEYAAGLIAQWASRVVG
ncbi:alpha/beta fold hydrolase [Luteolibacter sp. AS25]|uniref:alpha/beta fold hydrolase n=1 Tax=Luteolibacter sp. AS25 TaxID=3135776 RepID=UPI00398B5237